MVIESILSRISAYATQRYLTFDTYCPSTPPKPDRTRPYLLYIHIPFCEGTCPYCTFVTTEPDPSLTSRFFPALKRRIQTYSNLGYHFDSVYIGGGTPTIMPDQLAGVVSHVRSLWPIRQLSIETNPNHLVPDILQTLKDIGTTRLSVGVQSFNDEILETVERRQQYGSGQEIKDKLSSVMGMFDTINIDLIFNFPNQTEKMLAEDIATAKEINADQLTYYPLMTSSTAQEQPTRRPGKADYARERRLYELLVRELTDAYRQESVWCFSRKEGLIDEYVINHDEYAAVGPGSCGYVDGTTYFNTLSVEEYVDIVGSGGVPIIGSRRLSYLERLYYRLVLKLLSGSVSVSEMREEFGNAFWIGLALPVLFLRMVGALRLRRGNMTLTPRGRYYWLVVMRSMLSIVGDYRQRYDYGNAGSSRQADKAASAADSDDAERIPVTINSGSYVSCTDGLKQSKTVARSPVR